MFGPHLRYRCRICAAGVNQRSKLHRIFFRPGEPLDITAVRAAIVMWPAGDQGGIFFEIRDVRYENDPGAAGIISVLSQRLIIAQRQLLAHSVVLSLKRGRSTHSQQDPMIGLGLRMKIPT